MIKLHAIRSGALQRYTNALRDFEQLDKESFLAYYVRLQELIDVIRFLGYDGPLKENEKYLRGIHRRNKKVKSRLKTMLPDLVSIPLIDLALKAEQFSAASDRLAHPLDDLSSEGSRSSRSSVEDHRRFRRKAGFHPRGRDRYKGRGGYSQ